MIENLYIDKCKSVLIFIECATSYELTKWIFNLGNENYGICSFQCNVVFYTVKYIEIEKSNILYLLIRKHKYSYESN